MKNLWDKLLISSPTFMVLTPVSGDFSFPLYKNLSSGVLQYPLSVSQSGWILLCYPCAWDSSVTQSCPTLCDLMDCSTQVFPVHHQLPELAQSHVHRVVMPSSHLILSLPLLLPSSIFPSISDFSKESVLHIRWPKYWSFNFSISPSNEYSGLVSFRTDWFDLLKDLEIFWNSGCSEE